MPRRLGWLVSLPNGPVALDLLAIRGNSSFAPFFGVPSLHWGVGDVRRGGLAIIVSACLALAGCSLFGKKKPEAEQPPPNFQPQTAANTAAPANAKGSAFSTTSNPKAAAPGAAGMLAGRVICNYDRVPPPTLIQVVPTGEKSSESKGEETATDSQGYFTIQGLIPGQGYQLTARTRPGDVKMSGVTIATAPNPRVLIVISEDFGTPPPAAKKNNEKSSANETSRDDAPVRPGAPTATGSTAELSPPTGEAGSAGNIKEVASRDQPDRERIPLNMGSGGRGPPPGEGYGGGRQVSARVPSCTFLTELQLDNFALYDLTGMPWEYRNHKGRLVLIDFWGTWCGYCIKGIPHLKTLHESYSRYGLEIVGIAYEQPAPAGDQARLVQAKREQLKIPYRLLLGSNLYTCPVKTQFKVNAFPTMFLLDEHNRIIWQKDHALNDAEKRELDQIIRQELK